MQENFVAVKVGDVDGTATPNATAPSQDRSFNGKVIFSIDDVDMVAGEEYTVNFKAGDFTSVLGYQFTLNFDQSVVEFVDVQSGELAGLSKANFGLSLLDEGVITTSFGNTDAVSLEEGAVVFSVTLKAKSASQLSKALSLSSRFTATEAYNENFELMNVGLEFNNGPIFTSEEFALYQNQPNPFKDETVIGFNLQEAGAATISIYDVAGKVLKVIDGDYAKGYNQVTVTRNELSASGVLYYQLDTDNDSATMKMIIIE